ncbi:ASB18 [Branchiostoma lanceolatum]|uniref:ASB18 protein n=1 Tax=Branchiostoma lanceolatum TaxID=7740 RepID=A0A8K0ENF3_BRALA|nr:ASB18 [Branchiostoma lanceolatum]
MYSVTYAREVTTPLFLASSLGHHQLVSFLLQQGAEVNLPPKAWRLPIHAACEGGHSECVRLLLEYGADAEATDEDGFCPLHKCTSNDYLECVRVLVGFNAQVNARTEDEQSNSLLHIAAKAGLGDLVDLLLESGANPNLTNDELDTPLHMACFWTSGEERYHHTVANLVRNGADLNAVDGESKTPLHKACKNADHTIVQLLVDHGAKVNEMDWYGKTPLCHALQSSAVVGQSKGRAEVCVQILLNNGAWPVNPAVFHKVLSGCGYAVASIEVLINSYDRLRANSKWEKSVPDDVWRKHRHFYDAVFSIGKSFYSVTSAREITTPLQLAATNGHSDIVEYLLAQGAEVDFAPKEWTTPLSSACENGHAQCAKLLVEYGADVEYYNKSGLYPLHLCKTGDYLGCARALLEHGANPNARTENKESSTALHIAAELGYADLVELLCSRGADPNLKDREKETPMTVACYFTTGERKFYDTVANLIKGGADLQETDNDHLTPLHTICRRGDHNIVSLLIESGSQLNSRDWYGKTPICHALESTMYRREAGKPEVCVQLLLNNGAWPVNPKTLFKVFELCGRAIPSIEVLLNCYSTLEADSKWKKVLPRDVFEENQSFYEAVFRLGKSPPTLQHACRSVVRTLLGARCQKVISELSVAPRLKRYLLLEPGEGGLH